MQMPWMFPEYINIYWMLFSQTLLASILSLIFFVIFVFIYNNFKNKNKSNLFVSSVDLIVETIDGFFGSISNKISISIKTYILFLFFYILWNNLFWLALDMFATVIPFLHYNFRPANTDIYFNAILAIFGVGWSIVYWFKNNWFNFIKKFFPIGWFGIVWKRPNWLFKTILWFFIKIFDIVLWLFIWFLELISEMAKIISLSLRLFWNMFAWLILFMLIVSASIALFKVPIIAPLLVLSLELLISVLQAFVFALLVLIYFKMAEDSH